METSHYKVIVKESDVDSYGHLNNANYLVLYEEARWEIITGRGFGLNHIHKIKQGPIVLEVNLKFIKEIRLREEITIKTQVTEYKGKIGKILQQMVKSDGTVASEALFNIGIFDMKERKLIEPTVEWKNALGIE
ncbi:MAG: acyl-CoA thioesterase [Bdellovibrio sp.]